MIVVETAYVKVAIRAGSGKNEYGNNKGLIQRPALIILNLVNASCDG